MGEGRECSLTERKPHPPTDQLPDAHRHHVVALHVWLVLVLALVVELPEEVEGHHGVEVHHHSQQAHRHHQLHTAHAVSTRTPRRHTPRPHTYLFAVVGDRGQDGAERFDPHGDVQKVAGVEEVVVVSQHGHQHVPDQVEESLRGHRGRGLGLQTSVDVFPERGFRFQSLMFSEFTGNESQF